MLKALFCNLVKHFVKGLCNFTGVGLVVSVKDNLTVSIDRWIQIFKMIPRHDSGADFYFNICKCMLF